MEEKVEGRIEGYCQIYEQVYKRVSKTNPENAREIALKILEEVSKDFRSEQINQSRDKGNTVDSDKRNNDFPATNKQREALHKFGVKRIPESLPMKEASEVLNKLISFSRENDRPAIGKAIGELNRVWM